MKDYYKTLEVAKNATQDEIRLAYRKLAAKHHPDRGGDTAKFQEIQEAYAVLSDANSRSKYDNPQPEFGFNFGSGNPFDEIFKQFRQQQRTYTVMLNITLEQAVNGGTENIRINATGREKLFKIDIPVGIDDGQPIKYDKLLDDAILQIIFKIKPHPVYIRNGLNLKITKKINMFELIVGTNVNVETIYKQTMSLTIPPKTVPGTVMRMPRCGIKINNGLIGDLYVLIESFIPDKISEQLITHIKQEIKH